MKIKLIDYGYTNMPFRAHHNDAGADVYAPETIQIAPHTTVAIGLKFGIQLPDGYMGLIFPRSSMAKAGIVSQLPPIDSGYTGEIHAIVINTTNEVYTIEKNSRVAQLVILPIVIPDFTTEESKQRGAGAFGSTGQ